MIGARGYPHERKPPYFEAVKEPACNALMHETTNALMMMGLFSHELRSLAKIVS